MIFIVGNSRSGTTLLGRILGLNDAVFTFHELHFFEQLWSAKDKNKLISPDEAIILYAKLLKNQRSGYLSGGGYTEYLPYARKALGKVKPPLTKHGTFELFLKDEARLNNKILPCEQTPRNVLFIKELLELYPEVKIITMVRDPRDILLSQKGKWKRRFLGAKNIPLSESIRSWVNYHPITISKLWKINSSLIRQYNKHPSVLLVRFEDLIANPEMMIKNICTFLNISYCESMLSVPTIGSSNAIDGKNLGVNNNNAGNWKKGGLTNSEIYYCQQLCKSEMSHLNYYPNPIKANVVGLSLNAVTFPIKLILAFSLNIKRMKNIKDSVQRRMGIRKL